jgi:hypothetical protein
MSEIPVRWCLTHGSSALRGLVEEVERCGEWVNGQGDFDESCEVVDANLTLPDDGRQLVCRRNV